MVSLEKTEGFSVLLLFIFNLKSRMSAYSFFAQLKLIQFSHPLNLKVAKFQKIFSLCPHPQKMYRMRAIITRSLYTFYPIF